MRKLLVYHLSATHSLSNIIPDRARARASRHTSHQLLDTFRHFNLSFSINVSPPSKSTIAEVYAHQNTLIRQLLLVDMHLRMSLQPGSDNNGIKYSEKVDVV